LCIGCGSWRLRLGDADASADGRVQGEDGVDQPMRQPQARLPILIHVRYKYYASAVLVLVLIRGRLRSIDYLEGLSGSTDTLQARLPILIHVRNETKSYKYYASAVLVLVLISG